MIARPSYIFGHSQEAPLISSWKLVLPPVSKLLAYSHQDDKKERNSTKDLLNRRSPTIPRLQHRTFLRLRKPRLPRRQELGPHNHAVRAQRHRCHHPILVRNPAGRDHCDLAARKLRLQHQPYLGHQADYPRAARKLVPAGVDALRHNHVSAIARCLARRGYGADLHEDFEAVLVADGDDFWVGAGRGGWVGREEPDGLGDWVAGV